MADADSSLTPEKRLLKLIEEPESGKAAETLRPKTPGQALFSQQVLGEGIARAFEKGRFFFAKFKGRFGLREVNRVVIAAAGVLIVLYVIGVAYELAELNRDPMGEDAAAERNISDLPLTATVGPGSALLENLGARNVFLPFGQRLEKAAEKKNEASAQLLDLTKNLKLTGISYDPQHEADAFCMIEDTQKGITTFLRAGDRISSLKVERIREDSVVLELRDETIEIR